MNVTSTYKDQISETFIKSLRFFLTPDLPDQIPTKDTYFFTYPKLKESNIIQVKNMLDDGVSISGCCRFLSNIFIFDPALVNAIKTHQITLEESKLGKISSVLSWIGSDKYCTSDFFLLLVCTLLSDNFDSISQFCLKAMLDHYNHNPPKELSSEAIDVIIKYFSTNNDDFNFLFDVFNELLNISIKIKDEHITNNIIRAILVIIQKNSSILKNFDFIEILNTSDRLFQKLNIDALSLLGGIANTSESKGQFDHFFKKLAKTIIETFSEDSTQISVKNFTPISNFFSDFIIDYQLNFDSFKNFPQVTDVLPSSSFDSSISISNVLNQHQYEVLKTFQAIFHQFHHHLGNLTLSFFSSYVECLSENDQKNQCVETFIFYLYLIENIPKFEIPQTFCEVVLYSKIFSPEFTLFYADKGEFDVLNQLRNLALNFIYRSHPLLINNLNSNSSKFPFLFVENYSRLRTFLSIKEMVQFLNNSSIIQLTLVLKKLVEKMSENNLDLKQQSRVFSAWSTLFVCINDFLNVPTSIVQLFQSYDFTNIYLRHFFNPNLQPLIFSTLQRYMTMPNVSLSTIAQFCNCIYSYAFYNHNEKFQQLMTDLLACLESAINHNQEIVKEMAVITPSLLSFFLHFPTKELLKNTLNFLLLVSFNITNFSFSHDDMLSLGNTIRTMGNDGLTDKDFSIILSLLAGTKISNMSQDFTIKNPSFILLIMYASADDISPTIQFFYRLCQYSIFNCVQCHKGKLDLLLIELVKSYPNPFKYLDYKFNSSFSKDELLTVVIQFLSLIFTYQCSPQSVERFIELAVPIPLPKQEKSEEEDQKTIEKSDIFGKFLNCDVTFSQFSDEIMNQIISNCSNVRDIQYIFTSTATPIVINNIQLNEIVDGFTFSCYLMVDAAISQNYSQKQIIFRLYDSVGNSFLLYSSRSALLCEINSVTIEKASSVSLATDFPSCQWSMVTVTIRKIPDKESKISLIFSLNKDTKPPFTINDINYSGQFLTAQIGGFIEENNVSLNEAYCFLCSYYLFNTNLTPIEIGSLYSFGPKGIMTKNNKIKDLLSNTETKNNVETKDIVYSYIKPFLYVFREFKLAKLMIPFFGFSKFAPHFFLEKIVDIFRYVPLEQYEKYIPVISQFLMKSPSTVICYSLYLHFFMLFSESQSSVLFKQILFNFNIWFNAEDPQTVKRTVQHWTNVLFPDFSQVFIESTSIPEILTLIRIHCWFTDEESNNINHKRCKNIDVHFIRNCLNRLLAEYASYTLSMDDVRSILSNTFTTHDIQHKMSFLELLDSISSLIPDRNEVANELHFLFTTSRPDLFVATLNLILKLIDDTQQPTKQQQQQQQQLISNSDIFVSTDNNSSNLKPVPLSTFKTTYNTGSLKYPINRAKTTSLLIGSPAQNSHYNSASSLSSTSSIGRAQSSNINSSGSFVINYTTTNHIECILFNLNKQHFTIEMLDAVIKTSKIYPEALLIACMIACNLSEKEQLKTIEIFSFMLNSSSISSKETTNSEFLKRFESQKRLEKLKSWFVWPIILILKITTSKEHQLLMLKTILSISNYNFSVIDQILAFLDIIHIRCQTKVTTLQLHILDMICSKISIKSKKEERKMMYRFVRNLLFHFDCHIHSSKLLNEYKQSIFNNNNYDEEQPLNDQEENNSDINLNSMKDVQNLFNEQSLKNELVFRVDYDEENIEIFERVINKLDKFEFVMNSDEEDSLSCYVLFFKYLKNKETVPESERAKTLQTFAHEGWRNLQAMNISFKSYMSTFCNDFEKFFKKLENMSESLLCNLNEESIKLSLTSIDILNDRRVNLYCQSANLLNRFEALEMTDYSIWKKFNETNCLTKKEEKKSFYLMSNFECPFTKKALKLFEFEIDPFVEKSKPIFKKNVLYVKFNKVRPCTFAILPRKLLIATKFKKIEIQIVDLTYILYRSVNCFEFVKREGKTYVINFLNTAIEEVIKSMKQVLNSNFTGTQKPVFQTTSFSKFIQTRNITNEWVSRRMTTFEYLLQLNFLGGRSYQIVNNYPIFPQLKRDMNDKTTKYKVNPKFWLRNLPPFCSTFNDETTSSEEILSISSISSISSSTTKANISNLNLTQTTNEKIESNEYEKVQFEENSNSNSDNNNNSGSNQEEDNDQNENNLCIGRRSSDFLSSSFISSEKYEEENNNEIMKEEREKDTYESKKIELTPEFFTMPESFKTSKLTSKFKNEYEFIYENRKILESEEVSIRLNEWLDQVFGQQGLIGPLFKTPHPKRKPKQSKKNIFENEQGSYQLLHTITTENLIFGKMINHQEKLTIKTVSKNGQIIEHQIDMKNNICETTLMNQIQKTTNTIFSMSNEELLIIEKDPGILTFHHGTQFFKHRMKSKIEECGTDSVYRSKSGNVFSFETDTQNGKVYIHGESKISPELIVSFTSSSKYNMTAVSVESCKIILFERISGRYLRTIDTGGKVAKRLLITEGFGFIVSEFLNEIVVFTRNGDRHCEMEVKYDISYMTSFLSEDGFDFLFFIDKTGQIKIIEAFTFDIIEKSYHNIDTKIIDIIYMSFIGSLLILTEDGKLFTLS